MQGLKTVVLDIKTRDQRLVQWSLLFSEGEKRQPEMRLFAGYPRLLLT